MRSSYHPEYLPGDKYFGAFSLAFVDPVTEIVRADQLRPWSKQVVLPGDSLRALVVPNARMQIEYRRAGPLGIFERRKIHRPGRGHRRTYTRPRSARSRVVPRDTAEGVA
jgi:hypothetical protein